MFDFLANVVINDQEEVRPARKGGGPRKERNPQGLAIRVFRDGSVFPSQELVDKFNLEYAKATLKERKAVGTPAEGEEQKYQNIFEVEGDPGNGFDIIDTDLFNAFKVPDKRLILISPVSRTEGKVDLFASTTYAEDGNPKASVLSQGAKTFGAESLIPMLEEVYGVQFKKSVEGSDELTEGVEYVDLMFVANPADSNPWTLPKITWVPKTITRGERKGECTVTRRENAVVYVLMPAQPIEAEQPKEEEVEEAQEA